MSDEDAIAACQIALMQTPYADERAKAALEARLAGLYARTSKLNECISSWLRGITLDPTRGKYWAGFGKAIQYAEFLQANPRVEQAVLAAFSHPYVNPQWLAVPALSLLKLQATYGMHDTSILTHPLLLSLLENTIIPDAFFEKWMCDVRRRTLLQALSPPHTFLQALAAQCDLNEYIYEETADETAVLSDSDKNVDPLIRACYRSVEKPAFQRNETSSYISLLKPIEDRTSQLVQSQYEEHPYPRWKRTPAVDTANIHYILQQLFPYYAPPNETVSDPEVLIAGCGTGQQAIAAALTYASARVTAIDLSHSSLAYAASKTEEMGVTNIQWLQGDLLDITVLHKRFDVIECAGVLHHMQDPIKGWQALLEVLQPQGIMNISLYSEMARQDVVAARELIKQKGFTPSLKGIRACREALRKDPQFSLLVQSIDFYTTSACRDLLFHVQESRFTLLQIQEIMHTLDLELIGLEVRSPEALKAYQEAYPSDPRALSLENWHAFELVHPHTFLGMYHLWMKKRSST